MSQREYLLSLKNFFFFSLSFFIFSIVFGFFLAKFFPQRVLLVLIVLEAVYGEMTSLEKFGQFFFVILNNSLLLLLILLFSWFFCIFPILVLFSSGSILGSLIFFLKDSLPTSLFLTSVLPQGIFEIPVLILASASGLKIGKKTIDIVLKKEEGLRREIFLAFKFFLRILFPFLIFAAFIEVYLTPYLLKNI